MGRATTDRGSDTFLSINLLCQGNGINDSKSIMNVISGIMPLHCFLSATRPSIPVLLTPPTDSSDSVSVVPFRFLQDGHGDPTGAVVEPEVQARAALLRHDHRPPLRHRRARDRVSQIHRSQIRVSSGQKYHKFNFEVGWKLRRKY